jgi:hypothetical protein
MARQRSGQCTLCGCWLDWDTKGVRCKPCKTPAVKRALKQRRAERKANAEEVVISEEDLSERKPERRAG